jgi:hypothetical protein
MDDVSGPQQESNLSHHEIEYDPLMEEEMSLSLELQDIFESEQPIRTEDARFYDQSIHDDSHDTPDSGADADDGFVDMTDYSETDFDAPRDLDDAPGGLTAVLRLTMIERTLGEIQKYIGEILELVRYELEYARQKTVADEEKPPLPDAPEYDLHAYDNYADEHFLDFSDGRSPLLDEPAVHTGVFNGYAMITAEGRELDVPENYASKSRLVEGDLLKLTITPEGKMLYKQIGPARRRRITGVLEHDPVAEQYSVACAHGRFRVLSASVAYFHGIPGDRVLLLIAVGGPYRWGAIQSVIRQNLTV